MKKLLFTLSLLLLLVGCKDEEQKQTTPQSNASIGSIYFEGGGANTTGGAGGNVYIVSSLADDGGSNTLRYAIEKSGSRTIVFAISGTIHLKGDIEIKNGNLTIAGQTAPGGGITVAGGSIKIKADNVIIRFLRFRPGDGEGKKDGNNTTDAIEGEDRKNIVIDHCSISWGTDECASFYGNENFTMQYCIISEGLGYYNTSEGKREHRYGGLWGGKNATFHHNLLAHHESRMPRLDHDYVSYLRGPVDIVNNVIYNWSSTSTYGGESTSCRGANDNNNYRKYNLVNNYYKPGPNTSSKENMCQPWSTECENCCKNSKNSEDHKCLVPAHFYISGNYVNGQANFDWQGVKKQGEESLSAEDFKNKIKSNSRFPMNEIHAQESAEDAYNSVLEKAGACLYRDEIDTRIINEVETGTGSLVGNIENYEEIYPELPTGTAPTDTDKDGMPDEWETKHGLNPSDKADRRYTTIDGARTNLDFYLDELVEHLY